MASQPGAPQPQSWSPFRPTHAVFYSLAGALALAIANGLTKDTLLPAITRSIVEFIDPSTVSVKLKEPAENITAVKVKENWKLVENQVEIRHINNDTLNLKLAPGAYIARFEKGSRQQSAGRYNQSRIQRKRRRAERRESRVAFRYGAEDQRTGKSSGGPARSSIGNSMADRAGRLRPNRFSARHRVQGDTCECAPAGRN
ncbi:hypothetical protein LZK80_09905 [Rhizobium leguminosarum]|nr:hypothetical protein LZK80_09905 [Rhizobium leguminosarum]